MQGHGRAAHGGSILDPSGHRAKLQTVTGLGCVGGGGGCWENQIKFPGTRDTMLVKVYSEWRRFWIYFFKAWCVAVEAYQ